MSTPKEQKWAKKLWIAFGVFILATVLFFLILSFSNLPSFEQLENPKTNFASEVIAYNGQPIGGFYIENRVAVNYDELSPHIIKALISTEDYRYYKHSGIDFKALMRVGVKRVFLGQSSAGGGSTITQQLAKNLFHDPITTTLGRVMQKFKEWIIAVRLENRYTKEEIMTMYLNQIDFVNGAIGIKSASQIYFGKDPIDLSVSESATFVGMLQNPSLYNPARRADRTAERRNIVLKQLEKSDYITSGEYDSLKVLPIDMSDFKTVSHEKGLAPYFRMEIAKDVKKILASDKVKKTDGTSYNVYKDGLRIYTTIDPEMQRLAEEAMTEHMRGLQNTFFKVRQGKDPWTYSQEKASKELRANSLDYLVRNSDRFIRTFNRLMVESLAQLKDETGESGLDITDLRFLISVKDAKEIKAKLTSDKKSKGDKYAKILESDLWPEVKERFSLFEKEVEDDFNRKTPMRIFAYVPPAFEKDTIMTPLDSIKYHRMHLQTGVIAVEPNTGYVRAWVGGINYKYFQYDHVRTSRQVGSTFKPFVYATAIAMQGFSPCFPVLDEKYVIQKGEGSFGLLEPWAPQNSNGKYTGETYTLYRALRESVNTVSVYLMKQLGTPEPIRDLLRNMGVEVDAKRNDGEKRVPSQPSIALGAADLTVFEMTGAYTTFANNGVYNKPIFITHIEDANGRVIYRNVQEEVVALPPNVNYAMVEMLRQSKGGGYGQIKSDVGGKTGTTNDYVDGWYMGITPSLVVGTWVGGDDTWIRFLSLTQGQGSVMARPIYQRFLKKLEASENLDYDFNKRFFKPEGELGIVTDCDEYNKMHNISGRQRDSLNLFSDDFF